MMIAIDGPAASGKGTLARRLAAHYGLPHLDTGLLYRAVALSLLNQELPLDHETHAQQAAQSLDIRMLSDPRLREARMGEAASIVAAIPQVRVALLAFQRSFAQKPEGAVLDGRDIGTAVCPDAHFKLFITASAEERARRRYLELHARGEPVVYEDILKAIKQRDARDAGRTNAPLSVAPDAYLLDTTSFDADQAFEWACMFIEKRKAELKSKN
jgi:CMP/dCMP kinase